MKRKETEELPHQVTYRFVGGNPENGILSCGFMRKKTAQKSQLNFAITYYSCFVLLEGSGEYWDETGVSAPLLPGTVVQRLPGRIHSTKVSGDGKWLEFYISFGKCVFDSLAALGLLDPAHPVKKFPFSEQQIPAFQMLLSQMSSAQDHLLLPCLLEAEQIACALTGQDERRTELSPMTVRACEILERDLRREYSLEAVARALCVGYETFRKQFREEMGLSPDEYRRRKRMTTAQMMLMEGESVKSAAKTLGYSDAYSFSKQFKRFSGMSPSACRKQKNR